MSIERRNDGDIALVSLAHPPANSLNLALREALLRCFENLRTDTSISAVVLHGEGRGFSAGADRSELGTPAASARPALSRDILSAIENCGKPVVAALHGFAVGGGLELALACDSRIAAADTKVGLPEVNLGLIALSGTQRLPRLLGVAKAAELMMQGAIVEASALAGTALFDRIVGTREDVLPSAIESARSAVLTRPPRVRDRPIPDLDPLGELTRVQRRFGSPGSAIAQRAVLEALAAAVESPDFQSGLDHAQRLFDEISSRRRAR